MKYSLEFLKQLEWEDLEYIRNYEELCKPNEEREELIRVINEMLEKSEGYQAMLNERKEMRREFKELTQNCEFDITEDGEDIVYFDGEPYTKLYLYEEEED
tara:strand:- start:336 stop:638 length:303 start_codon:yes stop_codon:yes gene_type:complete